LRDYLLTLLYRCGFTTDEIIGLAIQTQPTGIVIGEIEPALNQLLADGEVIREGEFWERVEKEEQPVDVKPAKVGKAKELQKGFAFDVCE